LRPQPRALPGADAGGRAGADADDIGRGGRIRRRRPVHHRADLRAREWRQAGVRGRIARAGVHGRLGALPSEPMSLVVLLACAVLLAIVVASLPTPPRKRRHGPDYEAMADVE